MYPHATLLLTVETGFWILKIHLPLPAQLYACIGAVGSGPVLGTEALELLSKFLLYSEHVIYPVVKKLLSSEIKED